MVLTRSLLALAGLSALTVPIGAPLGHARSRRSGDVVTMQSRVLGLGYYLYFPFEVPAGTDRVEVAVTTSRPASVGLGLFDQRGPAYQSPGFRGVYGEERRTCWVEADAASEGFLPGPILPGTWTAVVPVFLALAPAEVTVTVTLRAGPGGRVLRAVGPATADVVRDAPGWYRGDLHCHTGASSDAWATGRSLTPRDWGDECRRAGLDFAALTDHNVVTQNAGLAEAAGPGVLLLGGEEMTNWFHGHATVSGLPPGAWLDWRQRPRGFPSLADEGRIVDFLRTAREYGAYVAAAHPLVPLAAWQFAREAESDPRAATDGLEVWNGAFQPHDLAAVAMWDGLLRRGRQVSATGGSDTHARAEDGTTTAGLPTTVVHAASLSPPAIVEALRRGRGFITRHPRGAEVYLSAEHPDGRRAGMGATLSGRPGDTVLVRALVRRAAGRRLVLMAGGRALSTTALDADDQTVSAEVPIDAGYVRAEVRGVPALDLRRLLASRLDMEALSNPVYLSASRTEDTGTPDDPAPPPPG